MHTFSQNPLNPFGFSRVVQALLPWRFRRMLVLSGTYGAISSMEKQLRNHAQELSEVLHLSRDHELVEVPIKFHSILVSKFNKLDVSVEGHFVKLEDAVGRKLSEEERKAMAAVLAENIPAALRYTHLTCMAEDIFRLLGFVQAKRLTKG